MPLFEFQCGKCKNRFEELMYAGEKDSGVECPKCKAKKAKRQFSAFGFKAGGGF